MVTCAVKLCRNYSSKKVPGVTFFKFPRDPVLRRKWIEIVSRGGNWVPTKYSCVCSVHFVKSTYGATSDGSRRLHKGAIPTKHFYINKINLSDEEQEDGSDSDNSTSDDDKYQVRDAGVQNNKKTYTNRKRATTDTESGGNTAKHTRLDIEDIKIDYDNVDMFGQQIVFLLKRLPQKLCRELQDSIVTIVKTAMKEHESKTEIDVTPGTSSSTKVVDILSQIVFTPTLVTKPNVKEEITVKKELEEESIINESTQATQYTETQICTPTEPFISTIKTFPKPMTVPIELVGSLDCVKHEVLDPEQSSDITATYAEQYNEANTLELTLSNPLDTDVKIEIDETDLVEEANRRAYSDE